MSNYLVFFRLYQKFFKNVMNVAKRAKYERITIRIVNVKMLMQLQTRYNK